MASSAVSVARKLTPGPGLSSMLTRAIKLAAAGALVAALLTLIGDPNVALFFAVLVTMYLLISARGASLSGRGTVRGGRF